MTESSEYVPPVEVEGGFADLGLESPNIQAPTSFPIGTHLGFVSQSAKVQTRKNTARHNWMITYKIIEAGPFYGREKSEYFPANRDDEDWMKGRIKGRMDDLGANGDYTKDPRTFVGTPVYFQVAEDRKNPGQTKIVKVTLDTDSEHVSAETISTGKPQPNSAGAVSSSELGY